MEVSSMDKVEFVGSVTEMDSAVVDDDDGFCPSDTGRSVACCSAGLD
jgi:hypothetical protein